MSREPWNTPIIYNEPAEPEPMPEPFPHYREHADEPDGGATDDPFDDEQGEREDRNVNLTTDTTPLVYRKGDPDEVFGDVEDENEDDD